MFEAFDAMSVSFDVIAAAFVATFVSLELISYIHEMLEAFDVINVSFGVIAAAFVAISVSLLLR